MSFKGVPGRMSSGLGHGTDEAALDLKRRISIFLSLKGVSSVRLLNIEVTNGTVTFRGTVASFYERQLCLSCQHVPGVRKVVDDLKVQIPSPGAPRFTLAPASGREHDRGRKPRFPRKLHEVGVETSQERRSQGCIRGDAG